LEGRAKEIDLSRKRNETMIGITGNPAVYATTRPQDEIPMITDRPTPVSMPT
jgi:hypothetical protein